MFERSNKCKSGSAFSVRDRVCAWTIGGERSNQWAIEVHLVLQLGFYVWTEQLGVKDQISVKLKCI